jgi:alkanesulfonate monooxygenase SsuD/methylene tetrahydromethanopterin reductase-like flavin-dependent oxidoreductase (luciferase family)
MAIVALRLDMRAGPGAAPKVERYRAALDMAQWADHLGLGSVVVSEHHGADDDFLPSPLVMAAAIGARTTRIPIVVSALILPLHDPLRVAEDAAVAQIISGGRLSIVAGAGYRPHEYEMFGVDKARRGRIMDDHLAVLRRAWTGEPFEYRGTTVRVTPAPPTPPMLLVGGGTEAAARRAARLGDGFLPIRTDAGLAATYHEERAKLGRPPGIVVSSAGPGFVYVADDVEQAWETIGPFALDDARSYGRWTDGNPGAVAYAACETIDDVRASGLYRVVTPDECVTLAAELDPTDALVLHPLLGGIDPDFGWDCLRRFETQVWSRL